MDDPQLIWRLGRWIANRSNGAARLAWSSGELVLRLNDGKVVSAEGFGTSEMARRLECEPAGLTDLLAEARALAADNAINETLAVGEAKEIIQEALRLWFTDSARELELVDGEPDVGDGPSISITHAIVELVLNDTERDLCSNILPDLQILLRRSRDFLALYSPLRLSEDADLIVAKITGQRTAEEIATRSPHGADDVVRLLGALVSTGMLEPVPVVAADREVDLLPSPLPDEPRKRRRIAVGWIVAGALALAVGLAAVGVWYVRVYQTTGTQPEGHWSVVIDMGCEPQDLQRILRKANQNPESMQALRAGLGEDESCWRLVWGDFPSRGQAEQAVQRVPDGVRRDGFEPHPIELDDPPGGEGTNGG